MSNLRLADLYKSKGEYKRAEALARAALLINEKVLPEEHPDIAYNNMILGQSLMSQKDFEQAEAFIQKAYTLYLRHYGDKNSATRQLLVILASVYKGLNEDELALPLFLQQLEDESGMSADDQAPLFNNMAGVYRRQGDYVLSAYYFNCALEQYTIAYGDDCSKCAVPYYNLANVYNLMGQYEQALPAIARAIDLASQATPGHFQIPLFKGIEGLALTGIGCGGEGIPQLEESVKALSQQIGAQNQYTKQTKIRLELARDLEKGQASRPF